MTNVKSPRVNIFKGSVNRINNGRKKALSIPSIAAAKKAEKKPLTYMPPDRYEVTTIATVKISHLRKIPFICFLFKCQILVADSTYENGAFDDAVLAANH